MANSNKNKTLLKRLLALGIKEHAKTASEEEIGQLLSAGTAFDSDDEHPQGCRCNDCMDEADDKRGRDSRGRDSRADDKRGRDSRSSDCDIRSEDMSGRDARGRDARGRDARGRDEDRERLHRALDAVLDSRGRDEEKKAEDTSAEDDEKELRGLFEREQAKADDNEDDEHPQGCRCNDCMDEAELEADDEAVQVNASEQLEESQRGKSPAASAVDAASVLRVLKPFVAKSTTPDGAKRLIKAFDTATKLVNGTAGPSKGSYSTVARAAASVGKDAVEQMKNQGKEQKIIDDANAEYAKMHGKIYSKK